MKKFIFPILLIAFANLSNMCFSQHYQWAKGVGSATNDAGNCITVDHLGNVYIAGTFSDITDFDPGTGIANLSTVGSEDIFFAKYDNLGNFIWAKSIGGTNQEDCYSISIDNLGYIYVTGSFSGTADFDPGPTNANLTVVGFGGLFFAKYDNNGNYIWAKSVDNSVSRSLAVDALGNVYITGYFWAATDFDPSGATASLTPIVQDVFFAKYDNNGNYLWAKKIGGTSSDNWGTHIEIDPTGNVIISGYFKRTSDFDPGTSTVNLTPAYNGYYDIFFAKYNSSNGNYIWAKRFGSSYDDFTYSADLDSLGNIYISGYFSGTSDFDPGTGTANITAINIDADIFFAKYDNNGNYLWAKNIAVMNYKQSFGIKVDNPGNLYITGGFQCTTDFDPGPGITNLTAVCADTCDIFFAKYDLDGKYFWARSMGGTDNDQGNGITVDSLGNVYLIGTFGNTVDFDPEAGTANVSSLGMYNWDIFFAKYSATTTTINEFSKENTSDFNIFPNPFCNNLSIKAKSNEQFDVVLYDITNRKILQHNFINNINLQTENLTKGIYIYEIKNKTDVVGRGKLIKE
ncbi:MAG: SBBP repeat-containing protein [Bacteroidia bacterium]|nr:SBBP repeat-containing protein [Bacteroidia bacterium]